MPPRRSGMHNKKKKYSKVADPLKGVGTSDAKKNKFFFKLFFIFIIIIFLFLKYDININTQVETTLLWDLFSIYDTVSNYFTSLLLI